MGGLNHGAAAFWEWQYLIFTLPFAIGALLLLLSSLRLGGHHGGHHHGSHHFGGHGAGHPGAVHHGGSHSSAPAVSPTPHAHNHGTAAGHHRPVAGNHRTPAEAARGAQGTTPLTIAMLLFGVGRAPLPMVIEFFVICWGLVGLWAVGNIVPTPHPNLFQMLPSLGLALIGGWAGSRGAAEVIGRLMPRDETSVVSRDALYGLTGKVAFPVSEKSGRIHVYDEFGTLHDEMCRVPDGEPLITRGSTVRIVDRDPASGRLLVEMVSPPPLTPTGTYL